MENRPANHPDTDDLISRLGELSRQDPDAFEEMRRVLIEKTIAAFPEEHRARAYGLQFRIDAELSLCKDPVSRMNRMVELFWDGVRKFEAAITDPGGFMDEKCSRPPAPVISLAERKDSVH